MCLRLSLPPRDYTIAPLMSQMPAMHNQVMGEVAQLGTRGQSLSKLLIGGVSENVIAQAPCPVMVVK